MKVMKTENELLLYIYQDCQMAVSNLTTLINSINDKDNKIKKDVEKHLKGYEKYLKESERLLKKHDVKPKDKGLMASVGSFIGIKKEISKDNSDARIADMLIKGLTMGTIDINKKIDNFKDETAKNVLNLASDLLKFQEDSIEDLKRYL